MKNRYFLIILSSIIVFALFTIKDVKSQYVVSSQVVTSGSNQIDISVSVDSSANLVKFVLTGPSTKWFGISFNTTSMSPGSYTILANINGGNPAEYIMVQHAAPTLQPVQNLQNITSSTASGRKTYVFYRNISTSDFNDFTFSYFSNNMSFAWAYGFNLNLSTHNDRGSSNLNFTNPCLNTNPTILPSVTICNGDSTMIFGQYRKNAATYSMVVAKQFDCDSIVKQTLIVKNPVTINLNPISICNGDSTMIFGQYRKISGTYSDTLQTIYSCDSILIQNLTVGNAVIINLPLLEICNGDSALIFGNYRHLSGLYSDTLNTMQGCDSISFVQLNVFSIDTSVVISSDSLIAIQGADSYQWYNCSTNQMINGETNYFLKTNVSGLYKVKITKNNCISYSSCYNLNTTSIADYSQKSFNFDIVPNPASNKVTLVLNTSLQNAKIEIFDLTGKTIVNQIIKNNSLSENIDITVLNKGLYFVKINSDKQSIIKKLIVK